MISCTPFLYRSSTMAQQLGHALLLVIHVSSSTEILQHRPEANKSRSLIWAMRTPELLNYSLYVLSKTSPISSVALLKPS